MARHRRPGRCAREPAVRPSSSFWRLALLLALLWVAATAWGYAGYRKAQTTAKQEAMLRALGTEGQSLFSSLDTDRDLYISLEEFRPIAKRLKLRDERCMDDEHERRGNIVASP
uniref:Selenoprotein N-like n=1 Tax=Phascolarctos cinereus TaxID=38626 RepID=A0A6P5K0R8_PHACI|nr:selenoprotein N-like [Phascolarctos cinereus]